MKINLLSLKSTVKTHHKNILSVIIPLVMTMHFCDAQTVNSNGNSLVGGFNVNRSEEYYANKYNLNSNDDFSISYLGGAQSLAASGTLQTAFDPITLTFTSSFSGSASKTGEQTAPYSASSSGSSQVVFSGVSSIKLDILSYAVVPTIYIYSYTASSSNSHVFSAPGATQFNANPVTPEGSSTISLDPSLTYTFLVDNIATAYKPSVNGAYSQNASYDISLQLNPVPESSTIVLLVGAGILTLAFKRRGLPYKTS